MCAQLHLRIFDNDSDHHAPSGQTRDNAALDVADATPLDRHCPGCGQTAIVAESRRQQENDEPVVRTHAACTNCGFVTSIGITYPNRRRTTRFNPPDR